VEKTEVSLQPHKNNDQFTCRPMDIYVHKCTFMIVYRPLLLRVRNISDKVAKKIKPHILRPIKFLMKIVPFMR